MLALAISAACSMPVAVATPTSSTTTSAATTPLPTTALPAGTPSPSATPTASPAVTATATPTVVPTKTPLAQAAYCTVADVRASVIGYEDHVKTALDWTNTLPDTYVPPDLVSALTGGPSPGQFALPAMNAADLMARRGDPAYATLLSDDRNAAVRQVIYADLSALRAAATAAGRPLVMISAYRSYEVQQLTFDYWVRVGGYAQALRTSARPGHSEHQLGTVVDFGDGVNAPWEYDDWATTPVGAWLAEHAAEYGFVMSFQKGKTPVTCYDYEPWHYRWVGKALAQQLVSAGLTLRELQARGLF